MRVHHLDCCSMCPFPERLVNGRGSLFRRGRLVTHCLLVETPRSGLVLVDTGIGRADVAAPKVRLGAGFVAMSGIVNPREAMTAHAQIRALGHDPRDVRHILVTHLDLDHAGGLGDFPDARVHVHADEFDAAHARRTSQEKQRYRPVQFAHVTDWNRYASTGEPFRGFAAVRELPGLPPEILAIPLPGHTHGHACIAVDTGAGWLVHAGDAYFSRGTITGDGGAWGMKRFEQLVAVDRSRLADNHARLGELACTNAADLRVFCAHDPEEFDALRGAPNS
jgi:glyoxylase-like metal-dependent hydrolase (beta-lactamase superfamily II)